MAKGKADNLEEGHSLGRYRIVSKIGAGGMGEVYLAEDTRLRRQVAVKILTAEIAADAARLRRFEREAHAASALNHPNILTIYEFGDDGGIHFLASEFVEGKTLREILGARKIEIADALRITIQIASALQAAHHAGIVHRDIKPENVMIRADGYVKVLDFGLAKLIEHLSAQNSGVYSEDTPTLLQTQAGIVMGTAEYMSPEQARGDEVDFRTDIFSLGIVLYELLTRRLPFTGETVNHLIVSILDKEPLPILAAFQIPVELKKITLRALEKDREQRYQTVAELISDLRNLRKRLEFEAEIERTSPDKAAATKLSGANITGQIETSNTIAVLPFVNMSRNEDNDYFSDGLAEELINVLSKIRGFRVAARTSAFSFKGKQATIAEIGHKLNVSSVLEGSVRIAGKRVRISTQLIKVADSYYLWSETYDRMMDDIFAVQDDIAQSVVEELRTMLLDGESGVIAVENIGSEVAEAVRGRAANPEAQRLMLLGRHFLDRTTREDTAQAIVYFRQALDLDAGYALGWAELGRAFSIEAGRGWIPVAQGFDLSRDATLRALSLEPNLAEAHAQLGRIQIAHDWDFRGAESSYRKALELAPGSSPVLDGAALLAYKLGQFDEALKLSRQLLSHNPLNAAFWHNLGLTCHAANLLEESEKAFRKALELVPQRFVTHALLALVLTDAGRAAEALATAQREPDEFWRRWSLAILYHTAGRKTESDEMIEEITKNPDGNAYQIAEIYSMRDEKDKAFNWLERAYLERDSGITHTKVNPRFRSLHDDSRWTAILKKIGFEL